MISFDIIISILTLKLRFLSSAAALEVALRPLKVSLGGGPSALCESMPRACSALDVMFAAMLLAMLPATSTCLLHPFKSLRLSPALYATEPPDPEDMSKLGAINITLDPSKYDEDFAKLLQSKTSQAMSPGRRFSRAIWSVQSALGTLLQPLMTEVVVPLRLPADRDSRIPGWRRRSRRVSTKLGYILVAVAAVVFDGDFALAAAVLVAQPVSQLLGLPDWAGIVACMVVLTIVPF
eukprot:scaffold4061_cov222-Pinguiococcus_pyrenoidosus.AAC.2